MTTKLKYSFINNKKEPKNTHIDVSVYLVVESNYTNGFHLLMTTNCKLKMELKKHKNLSRQNFKISNLIKIER